MSVAGVKEYLSQWGAEGKVQEFSSSSATVAEAAALLHCSEGEIAKTMSFMTEGKAVLVVMAGDSRISNPKFKEQFHTKAVMLKSEELVEMTGHPAGGVCPFAVGSGVPVYLDKSLRRFQKVYPAAGSASSAVGLTLEELEKYSKFSAWVDIAK